MQRPLSTKIQRTRMDPKDNNAHMFILHEV